MRNRFACLIAAVLALTAGPRPLLSASPSRPASADVDILVDGLAAAALPA